MTRVAMTFAVCVSSLAPMSAALAQGPYDAMIAMHASANGVPEALVRRVIVRESRYNPRAVSKGNYGMMQIKLATARGLGYTGTAQGLLDANTNLTYAVKYLAGAYRAAHGNHNLAVRYYAGGYYYAAKRQGWNSNAQRVANAPAAPLEVASLNANSGIGAPAASPAVLPPPPGSRAATRRFEAEVAANRRRGAVQVADATVGPFTIFAPKPQPVRRHHTRHRHRR
jgi:hypothetical protein